MNFDFKNYETAFLFYTNPSCLIECFVFFWLADICNPIRLERPGLE